LTAKKSSRVRAGKNEVNMNSVTKVSGQSICKICGSEQIAIFAHTAKCRACGALLFYPYPEARELGYLENVTSLTEAQRAELQAATNHWHIQSGERNHNNFTQMALFALTDDDRQRPLKVLDYGGGGGQFALVAKSLFPLIDVYVVDLDNNKLLDQYRPLNKQIKFEEFEMNSEKFDVIFMNDVFEHVTDPRGVLADLRTRLVPGGRIFIDTPCEFWLYPVTKFFSRKIHTQLLRGTVDADHQQIWTSKSFDTVVHKAELKTVKFVRLSEYTQPASFYLKNMGITNPIVKLAGRVFFSLSPLIARNKIMAIVTPA
jgi:2-polyprenyl-3-methyl-5-hydroxy-6-metoxy-1,4-benzoquinol methylase